MAAETAYPLYWPTGVKRTPANQRSDAAPFSVGGEREDTRINYENGLRSERKVKVRTSKRVTVAIATERLEEQLRMLDAQLAVLSTNLELRLNGLPRGGQSNPPDPGAVIWFTLKGRRIAMPSDHWVQVADNIAALAAHIRATRSIERYGVATIEQAFRGYQALEDYSGGAIPWRRVLGFKDDQPVTLDLANAAYRDKIKRFHSDVGGDRQQTLELNQAIAQARVELTEVHP